MDLCRLHGLLALSLAYPSAVDDAENTRGIFWEGALSHGPLGEEASRTVLPRVLQQQNEAAGRWGLDPPLLLWPSFAERSSHQTWTGSVTESLRLFCPVPVGAARGSLLGEAK